MNIERQHQLQKEEEERREEENRYYNYIYYLAELSTYKLNEKNRNEPTLRRQVLIRNLLEISSQQLLLPSHDQVLLQQQDDVTVDDEENWLNACFEQLDQDEPMDEDNETNGQLVLAVPLNYNSSGKETVFLI